MLIPKSNISADRQEATRETLAQRLREEQQHTAEVSACGDAARAAMEKCDREVAASAKRQATLSLAIGLLDDLLGLAPAPESGEPEFLAPGEAPGRPTAPDGTDEAKPRLVARLGGQHYRMLRALRDRGRLALPALATASIASLRRVRVQMAEDAKRGVVAVSGDACELTPLGADLLRRFEEFRHSTGQDLPSLVAPQSEADRDEADPETPDEGGEG